MDCPRILDLFAGPGGWEEGLALCGRTDVLGVELDPVAASTATAAGHQRIVADVAELEPGDFHTEGIVASPPCQGFSMAGKGAGRLDTIAILAAVTAAGQGRITSALARLAAQCEDPRSALLLQPLRYVLATSPAWTAWEQVPTVLPLWQACAEVLRGKGYHVWTGNLHAERYGVPQTRKRAILIASRKHPVGEPAPTHSRYNWRRPTECEPGRKPWVSMADALGWNAADLAGFPRLADRPMSIELDGKRYRARDVFEAGARPAPTLTEKARSWSHWVYRGSTHAHSSKRPLDHPAPTVMFGKRQNTVEWIEAGRAGRCHERGIQVSVHEAAVLQSFRPDYPWQGLRTAQYRQIGDAIPPLLAAAIVAQADGRDQPSGANQ